MLDDPSAVSVSITSPFFACRQDPRVSYCLYVPRGYRSDGRHYPLLVVVHGKERNPEVCRQWLRDFADTQQCLLLLPLFPAGFSASQELHNYQEIAYQDLRFDLLLLAMVDEVREQYRLNERFLLLGFDGGGDFAQRFFYLHPERLAGLSLAAPDRITLPDPSQDCWYGVGDIASRFGCGIDYSAMKRVPVHMVVGQEDTQSGEEVPAGQSTNRLEQLRALSRGFWKQGIQVQLDVMPGVGHDFPDLLAPIRAYLRRQL